MKTIGLMFFIFLILACSHISYVDEMELRKIINNEKNGLKKTIESNQIKVIATYKPADLVALNEIKTLKENKESKIIDSILNKYSQNYYFILSFSINNKSLITQVSASIRNEVLNKFNYGLKENIFITYNSNSSTEDTLRLSDYMYIGMYGASNSDDIIISFNKEQLKDSEQFAINIKNLSNIGTTENVVFKKSDIEKLPKIKF